MYLELNDLKNNRTPQKMQEIITESERNLSEFQTITQKIIDSKRLKNNYVFESPTKIQKALRRERKSVEETKQLIKNLSDQKLLSQLEKVDSIEVSRIEEDDSEEKVENKEKNE